MANELIINYPSGSTLYALLFDATGNVWNGSSFVAPASANWTDYDIAMTEVATATGVYRASMPAAAAGVYGWTVRKQAGGAPAVGDVTVGVGRIEWTGTAEIVPLASTVVGRTLDVSVTGEAALDFDNVKLATGATTLTNITVPVVTTLTNMPAVAPTAAAVATQVWTGPDTKQINSVSGSVNSVATGVTLADGAITSAKFDESTAFPIKLADTGSTKIARTGADSDTLETLSDQLDAIQAITDAIDTSAVTVTSSNSAGVLTFTQGVTFSATVSGLTISATWEKLYFTLKESDYDTDDLALLQLVESNPGAGTDGLLYLNSAAIASPITVTDGSLTVSQAAGTVAIAITDNAMAALSKASGLVWDIKTKDTAGATVQNATGTASIGRAITQTI